MDVLSEDTRAIQSSAFSLSTSATNPAEVKNSRPTHARFKFCTVAPDSRHAASTSSDYHVAPLDNRPRSCSLTPTDVRSTGLVKFSVAQSAFTNFIAMLGRSFANRFTLIQTQGILEWILLSSTTTTIPVVTNTLRLRSKTHHDVAEWPVSPLTNGAYGNSETSRREQAHTTILPSIRGAPSKRQNRMRTWMRRRRSCLKTRCGCFSVR